MRRAVVFTAACLLAACATKPIEIELGIGHEASDQYGRDPVGTARLIQPLACDVLIEGDRFAIEYDHKSSIPDGWPLNNDAGISTNAYSVIYRAPLWRAPR